MLLKLIQNVDEVESLTAARAGAMAGTEPSDALRVVNALLTQLDKLNESSTAGHTSVLVPDSNQDMARHMRRKEMRLREIE